MKNDGSQEFIQKHAANAWDPLQRGDTVAVVNPCMNDRQSQYHADQYEALLSGEMGYNVNGLDALREEQGSRLWSSTPQERADRVIDAITNPDNKAIFLLVGGDGANETMKLVADWHDKEKSEGREGLPMRGIPVIGLSNNTTLLNPLAQMGIISPVQGKLDAAISPKLFTEEEIEKSEIVRKNATALHNLLSGNTPPTLEFAIEPLNKSAREYKGEKEPVEIVGGCNFHIIESVRTPFQVETNGKYLAVEGPEEQCSVKETLEGLQREGMLDGVKGVFLGYIAGYNENPAKQKEVKDVAEQFGIPVYSGMLWGHIGPGNEKDVYLPLHTDAQLEADDNGKATLKVNPFRTKENLEQA